MAQTKIPFAPKHPEVLEMHGHHRIDNYFWLKNRDSKEVLDYLNSENEYAKTFFKPLESTIQTLMNEFEGRIDPNELSAPFFINGQLFQYKNLEGKEYQQILLIDNNTSKVFFDENERAKNHSFYELADWSISLDQKILAVSEDYVGRRQYEVRFRENKSTNYLKDVLKNVAGNVVWSNNNKSIYYCKKDPETLREYLVYQHIIGTDQTKDVLVYEEKDEKYSVFVSKSDSKESIKITCYSATTSEVFFINGDGSSNELIPTLGRDQNHLYDIENDHGMFYILSNLNAENNRLLISNELGLNWEKNSKIIVEHNSQILLEGFQLFSGHILIEMRQNGLNKIQCISRNDNKARMIEIAEETYSIGLGNSDDFNAPYFFYNYTSMTTPASVYKIQFSDLSSVLWHQKKLTDPSFSSDNYKSERIWATANDGSKVPVCLVYKKGIDLSKAPLLLYGYGSYGYTLPDVFRPSIMSLLDRGFVYATAHIRGSKYMGEQWYQDGKLDKKINTFTDFINAADYLAMKGYCDANKIYAWGGSAGGLLMGAVTNMAPYRWKGIISQVPFVDVVSTMLDETIPLTTVEYEEWGNPNDPNFYYYMLNYSPYDNLKSMNYPAIYITTGYHDSQVQYWEPAKYVAKLRELSTNNAPLIFDCNMDAGHGGGSGRTNDRLETAKVFAFLLHLENPRP